VPGLTDLSRTALGWFEASRAVLEGQRGFFVPRVPSPAFNAQTPPAELSYYDTAPLAATLERLVDFERINHKSGLRLTVSAVNVANGNFELFDNQRGHWAGRLRTAHIMASGALPPGFAAVEIEGQHYWDGGLVSNTPLSAVLDEEPRRDTLAFQVDLWSARGPLPKNLLDVEERVKDIRFSSRTRAVTQQLERERHLRRLLRELLERMPAGRRRDDAWCREAHAQASDKVFNVVHLIYQEKSWDTYQKDYEFSALSMRDHWASGLADIRRTLAHPDWLAPPPELQTTVTHDVHRVNKGDGKR
jgi:NTE family protein